MKIRQRDDNKNLPYTCPKCGKQFNFTSMRYLVSGRGECPKCGAKIKF